MNCFPLGAVNSFAGKVYSPVRLAIGAIVPLPPLALKVNVYVTTGMSSQIAYTVLFSVISTFVTIAPSAVNDHPLNCFPLGAVNPFAGNVYSPVKPVFAVIEPVPPLASKVNVYVTTGMSSQIAYTFLFSVISTFVTIAPLAVNDHPLNCFPLGAVNPFAGNVYSPVKSAIGVIEPVPPLASNVNVYVDTGISSQIAYTVLFSVIATLVTVAPSVVNDHPLNCFPLGAVNPFAGNVYSPVKSAIGAIEPVPPLASNVSVYLFSIHFA